MKKTIAIALIMLISILAMAQTVFGYADSTLACIDRVNGEIIKTFPDYSVDLKFLDEKVQTDISDFCLSNVPSTDYADLDELGKYSWELLENFAAKRIVKENVFEWIMTSTAPNIPSSTKTDISEDLATLLALRNEIKTALSSIDYFSNPSSFIAKTYVLIEAQYSKFETFANYTISDIDKNYTCKDNICTLTSALTTTQPVIAPPTGVETTPFKDIKFSPFKTAITYVKDQGIVDGYNDGSYRPESTINRAEFTKIVINSLGISPVGNNCFSDVKDEWFASFVCTAKAQNILSGYPDGTFKPAQNINQAEALKILINAFLITKSQNAGTQWYDIYMNSARENDLFTNLSENAANMLLRGEMAQLIYNIKN